jgi:antibiotic biosynthesis monooxygenase (ABM) superfamily enzyme
MVLYVIKWDIHPDKMEDYTAWAKSAIPRLLAVPGIVEFRAYRPATGSGQVVTTYEFSDYEAWSAWYSNKEIQQIIDERRAYVINDTSELWGPSPVVPAPIRPGQ